MRTRLQYVVIFAVVLATCSVAVAQAAKKAGVLSTEEVKKVVPSTYFYRGQSASTQLRNTAGVRTEDQKYLLAGMVDTSGYASDVAQKYQGFFITEVKLDIGGSQLAPGEYGFGFTKDKFVITDVGANEVFSVAFQTDNELKRPVPLKIVEDNGSYRLYAGRKWVAIKIQ